MTMVVAMQVFCRYLLNQSLFWSEELARYLLIWLSLLGATVAYYRGAHVGVDLVYRRMPPRFQTISKIIVHGVALLFFGVLTFHGVQFAHFVRAQITPALNLPKWIVFSIIPLSGVIFIVHNLNFFSQIHQKASHDR